MNKSIGVIVPVYNRSHLIVRCLDSIVKQTVKPNEIIIVDNNSTDDTVETVRNWIDKNNFTGIKLKLLIQPVKGACAARQMGLEGSESDFLIFMDSDDEMHLDLIEKSFREIEFNHSIDIVCWKCRIHQLNGNKKIPDFNPREALENHLIHALLRPQGYIVRKSFLQKVNGWERTVKVWNDYELGLRLLLNNPVIEGIDEVLSEIYSQKESITGTSFSSKEGQWEESLDIMEDHLLYSSHPLKNQLLKIIDYRRIILAAHYSKENNGKKGQLLKNKVIKKYAVKDSILLNFAYHYTRFGGRGAWRIIKPLFK